MSNHVVWEKSILITYNVCKALVDTDYLPAIINPEILEVNFQPLAFGNVDVIETVHVMWIVAWISGTGKLVILHISTSCHLKTY